MKLAPLALWILAPPASVASELAFAPEQGSTVSKQFHVRIEGDLEDYTVEMNGQDITSNVEIEGQLSVGGAMQASLHDAYEKIADGRPVELVRTFDELSFTALEGESEETVHVDALEGTDVRFSWDEKEERYERSVEGAESRVDALDALAEDADLRALLPPDGEVEVGDTWEVEPGRVSALILPGIDLEGGLGALGLEGSSTLIFAALLAGLADSPEDLVIACEYRGTRERDGETLAAIDVTIEGGWLADLGGVLDLGEMVEIEGQAPVVDAADLELEIDGEGELLWSSAAGRFVAYGLQADVLAVLDLVVSVDVPEQSLEFVSRLEFAGEAVWEAEAEAP